MLMHALCEWIKKHEKLVLNKYFVLNKIVSPSNIQFELHVFIITT